MSVLLFDLSSVVRILSPFDGPFVYGRHSHPHFYIDTSGGAAGRHHCHVISVGAQRCTMFILFKCLQTILRMTENGYFLFILYNNFKYPNRLHSFIPTRRPNDQLTDGAKQLMILPTALRAHTFHIASLSDERRVVNGLSALL